MDGAGAGMLTMIYDEPGTWAIFFFLFYQMTDSAKQANCNHEGYVGVSFIQEAWQWNPGMATLPGKACFLDVQGESMQRDARAPPCDTSRQGVCMYVEKGA